MQTPQLAGRFYRDETEARDAWAVVIQHLLEDLVRTTASNFAILRIPEGGDFVLQQFAPASYYHQTPHLVQGEFDIPGRKGPKCWGADEPMRQWGVANGGGPLDGYPPGERDFINWVGQKAWFPLALEGISVGLMTLVRGGGCLSYRPANVVDAWLVAQEYISSHIGGTGHAGFVQALNALTSVRAAPDRGPLFQALAHCLASRLGLSWNRVWLLEEVDGRANRFSCRSCLGRVNNEEWARASQHEFNALEGEVRYAMVHPDEDTDPLSACCSNGRLTIDLTEDEAKQLFVPVTGARGEARCWLARILDGDLAQVGDRFQSEVAVLATAAQTATRDRPYSPADKVYAHGLWTGSGRLLVVCGQLYARQSLPSLILTSVYLYFAARVVREWEVSTE